ncbi:unnamed protein product [Prunus armeniaca]|uniref:Secreted protein n=1 Tax=Prunus armeniaca TaxID=36596 RepID=A0A6J5U1V7_PRUAR|nr:unnamed protein product [Prunus armeniaca]
MKLGLLQFLSLALSLTPLSLVEFNLAFHSLPPFHSLNSPVSSFFTHSSGSLSLSLSTALLSPKPLFVGSQSPSQR